MSTQLLSSDEIKDNPHLNSEHEKICNEKYEEKIQKELGNVLHYPNEYLYQKFYFDEEKRNINGEKYSINRYPKLPDEYQRIPNDTVVDYPMKRIKLEDLQTLENVEENCVPYFSWHQKTRENDENELKPRKKIFRVVIISDSHERHQLLTNLPPCDLFIHSGDILMKSRYGTKDHIMQKYSSFYSDWLIHQPFHRCLLIGGNHDKYLETLSKEEIESIFPQQSQALSQLVSSSLCDKEVFYLRNQMIRMDGKISVFGTPLSYGASTNDGFQSIEFEEETIRALESTKDSPIDLFISHGPIFPYSSAVGHLVRPQLFHVHGHLHYDVGCRLIPLDEVANKKGIDTGICEGLQHVVTLNASLMDMNYEARELPLVIDVILIEKDEVNQEKGVLNHYHSHSYPSCCYIL